VYLLVWGGAGFVMDVECKDEQLQREA
jgi:hypothetical protein